MELQTGQPIQRHELTMKSVLYSLPGMEAVAVRRDLKYRSGGKGALTMDVYYPSGHALS